MLWLLTTVDSDGTPAEVGVPSHWITWRFQSGHISSSHQNPPRNDPYRRTTAGCRSLGGSHGCERACVVLLPNLGSPVLRLWTTEMRSLCISRRGNQTTLRHVLSNCL